MNGRLTAQERLERLQAKAKEELTVAGTVQFRPDEENNAFTNEVRRSEKITVRKPGKDVDSRKTCR